jgi:hypothetical protein
MERRWALYEKIYGLQAEGNHENEISNDEVAGEDKSRTYHNQNYAV